MNIESTIRENIDKLKYDYTAIYVSPDIPTKKLDNAIAAYARDVQPGYVLALYDSTVFGSAKDGILFLGDRMYFSWNRRVVNYLDIQDVELLQNYKVAKDGTRCFLQVLSGKSCKQKWRKVNLQNGESCRHSLLIVTKGSKNWIPVRPALHLSRGLRGISSPVPGFGIPRSS